MNFYKKTSTVFYILAAISIAAFFLLRSSGYQNYGGWLLLLFFLNIAAAFNRNKQLKGMVFTLVIFAGVSITLYHPEYFTAWGTFKLSSLIIPLIQLIMFGMGTSMSVNDFAAVVKTPKGVIIGIVSHMVIMPLTGFMLARFSSFQPEIAAGIILIGCSPSGLASNVMSYLAKANLALSITITAVATLLSPFVTPVLMKLLAGTLIEIDATKMMFDIFKMIIVPIGAGLLFNKLLHGKSQWLDKAMPLVSMFGIAFIIVIIVAAGRNSLLKIGPALIAVVLLHNLFGYLLGYWSGRICKLPESDCRTIAIEVGMQNAGLASGIAKEMGKIATVGLAAAVFAPLMNITGSILASWWHNRQPEKQTALTEAQTVQNIQSPS